MTPATFTKFFSENRLRFDELIQQLKLRGYATDEGLKISRVFIDTITQEKFDEVFFLHYPNEPHGFEIGSTAIRRFLGEFVYVVYDCNIYEDIEALTKRIKIDGVLDIEPSAY